MPVPPFDHRATGSYSLPLAYWFARSSDLAYKDETTIDKQAHEWGFDQVRHHATAFTPPFPLQDTQAYTMADGHMVVTAFRGTQPEEIRDWLTDATTPPAQGPAGTGYVHHGFAQALESVYPKVQETITDFRDNGQTVWFTGHSLGGALAMLAACRLYLEDPKLRADGVYTYGAPRTCDPMLADACNKAFTGRFHRFVNNNDIVPQLPPEPVFHHVDALRHFDAHGRIHESVPMLTGLLDRAKGITTAAFSPTGDGIRDHFMANYLTALERNCS